MALTNAQILSLIQTNLPDNNTKFISAAKLREVLENMNDSLLNLISNNNLLGLAEWDNTTTYPPNVGVIYNNNIYKSLTQTTIGSFESGEWEQISTFISGDLNDYILKDEGIELDATKKVKEIVADSTISNLVTGFYKITANSVQVGLDKEYPEYGSGLLSIMNSTSQSQSLSVYQPYNNLSHYYIKKGDGDWVEIDLGQNIDIEFENGLTDIGGNVKLGGELIEDTFISGTQFLFLGTEISNLNGLFVNSQMKLERYDDIDYNQNLERYSGAYINTILDKATNEQTTDEQYSSYTKTTASDGITHDSYAEIRSNFINLAVQNFDNISRVLMSPTSNSLKIENQNNFDSTEIYISDTQVNMSLKDGDTFNDYSKYFQSTSGVEIYAFENFNPHGVSFQTGGGDFPRVQLINGNFDNSIVLKNGEIKSQTKEFIVETNPWGGVNSFFGITQNDGLYYRGEISSTPLFGLKSNLIDGSQLYYNQGTSVNTITAQNGAELKSDTPTLGNSSVKAQFKTVFIEASDLSSNVDTKMTISNGILYENNDTNPLGIKYFNTDVCNDTNPNFTDDTLITKNYLINKLLELEGNNGIENINGTLGLGGALIQDTEILGGGFDLFLGSPTDALDNFRIITDGAGSGINFFAQSGGLPSSLLNLSENIATFGSSVISGTTTIQGKSTNLTGGDLLINGADTVTIDTTDVQGAKYQNALTTSNLVSLSVPSWQNVLDESATKLDASEKGATNGVAELDGGGKVPLSQLPTSVQGGIKVIGFWDASTNTPDLTLLTLNQGEAYQVSVVGSTSINGETNWNVKDLVVWDDNLVGNYFKLDNTDDVLSVNGQTGVVVLDKNDVGLSNVDNTSDADKPISTATQTALDGKKDDFTASNGLTEGVGTLKLGGALTENTTIEGANLYSLTLGTNTSYLNGFNVYSEGLDGITLTADDFGNISTLTITESAITLTSDGGVRLDSSLVDLVASNTVLIRNNKARYLASPLIADLINESLPSWLNVQDQISNSLNNGNGTTYNITDGTNGAYDLGGTLSQNTTLIGGNFDLTLGDTGVGTDYLNSFNVNALGTSTIQSATALVLQSVAGQIDTDTTNLNLTAQANITLNPNNVQGAKYNAALVTANLVDESIPSWKNVEDLDWQYISFSVDSNSPTAAHTTFRGKILIDNLSEFKDSEVSGVEWFYRDSSTSNAFVKAGTSGTLTELKTYIDGNIGVSDQFSVRPLATFSGTGLASVGFDFKILYR